MGPQGLSDTTRATITPSVIRGEIDRAVRKGHGTRADDVPVLALRAMPDESLRGDFRHQVGDREVLVKVRPCVSALAAVEALGERDAGSWLVIVTDRLDDDLGSGILAHLIDARVHGIDPWQSACQSFGAVGVDRSLAHLPHDRAIAEGLMALHGSSAGSGVDDDVTWPAAPGGLLTRDHALGTVAHAALHVPAGPVDGLTVLRWSTDPSVIERLARLRSQAGDALTAATVDWLAERTGPARRVVARHLAEARPGDLVPIGLVSHLLAEVGRLGDAIHAPAALAVVERLAGHGVPELRETQVAEALGQLASLVTHDLLASNDAELRRRAVTLVQAADRTLADIEGGTLARFSDLLPSGLQARLGVVAQHLADDELSHLENAWGDVRRHALGRGSHGERNPQVRAQLAGVRLARWLHLPDAEIVPFVSAAARRQISVDSWVDSAVHDAAHGSSDADHAAALRRLLERVRERRDRHDDEFAQLLVKATAANDALAGAFAGAGDPVLPLEHVVDQVLVPLARRTPVLFLVLDGLSGRVADELVDDIIAGTDGWDEYLLPNHGERAAAIAALPTLTTVSRTSLLCGRLIEGTQQTEKQQHPLLLQRLGISDAVIFHKKELDSSVDGFQLPTPVREALDDMVKHRVVTCVLNTVDDALDRSDPGGMQWRLDDIKHLRPLLELARANGRLVVIASDHGHIVERRAGHQMPGITSDGGRVRLTNPPAGLGEVLVDGHRVLGGPKVLAVQETLRYGPLKAGYHGGAAPAEAVVPLIALAASDNIAAGLKVAPSQRPTWWNAPLPQRAAVAVDEPPALFELPNGLGARVVASPMFADQKRIAGRIMVDESAVAALINQLAGMPGQRLPIATAAQTLQVPERQFSGAFAQVQKLLNVEGYASVRSDAGSVVLDLDVLTEQFGV